MAWLAGKLPRENQRFLTTTQFARFLGVTHLAQDASDLGSGLETQLLDQQITIEQAR